MTDKVKSSFAEVFGPKEEKRIPTEPLVVTGRRLEASEARGTVWLRTAPSRIPEIWVWSDDDEGLRPPHHASGFLTCDGRDEPGAVYRAINPDGSPVMVPCTRDEMLEWAGYKQGVPLAEHLSRWWDLKLTWMLYDEGHHVDVLDSGDVLAEYDNEKSRNRLAGVWFRPVDAVGNYDPAGWGE